MPDGLERLARSTSPAHVGFEIDVYRLAYAGADPAARIRRHAGRVDLVHLEDGLLDRPSFRPLGRAEVELGPILAVNDAGTEALIVEQDECEGSPHDAIAESLAALCRLLPGLPR